MMNLRILLEAVTGGSPPGFSYTDAIMKLVQFVGYFHGSELSSFSR